MQERITLRNESPEPLEVDVSLEAEADFADIISVKLHDFSLGDPELAQPLPAPAPTSYDEASRHVSIVDPRGDIGTQAHVLQGRRLRGERDDLCTHARAARALGSERGRPSLSRRGARDLRAARRGARDARATESPPGRSAFRACAAAGTACAAPSTAPSTTSPRCGCGRESLAARSSPPGCRGS